MKPNNQLLRYYGGKWRNAGWIISHFPDHYTYVEPFGGSAGILFNKRPARIEVYNDLDHAVVTFFRVLREQPDHLIRAIELTPWSREELYLAHFYSEQDSDLEIARKFYIACWQGYNQGDGCGWRYQHSDNGYSVVEQWSTLDHLYWYANRLKSVQIENDQADNVLRRYDTAHTLFYVDPPYVRDTRYKKSVYAHEMSDADHLELSKVLRSLSGYVVLSGYDNPLYQKLYADWVKVERSFQTQGKNRTECLWLSPNVSSLNSLPLFKYSRAFS